MNKHRGEVAITLTIDGEERTLAMRPTFECIAAIETQQGGILDVMQSFATHRWKIIDLIAIVNAGLSHDKSVKPNQIRDAILSAGAVTFVGCVTDLLANAISGGRESEGNAEASS